MDWHTQCFNAMLIQKNLDTKMFTNFTKQFWQTEQPKFYKAVWADCCKKRRNKQCPCQRVINYGTVWRKDPANWGLESEEDGDSPSNQQTILLLLNQVRKMVTLPTTSRLFYCCWTSEEDGDSPSNQQTILLLLNQVRKMVTLPATNRVFYCCWTSEEDGDSPSNQQTILLLLNSSYSLLRIRCSSMGWLMPSVVLILLWLKLATWRNGISSICALVRRFSSAFSVSMCVSALSAEMSFRAFLLMSMYRRWIKALRMEISVMPLEKQNVHFINDR